MLTAKALERAGNKGLKKFKIVDGPSKWELATSVLEVDPDEDDALSMEGKSKFVRFYSKKDREDILCGFENVHVELIARISNNTSLKPNDFVRRRNNRVRLVRLERGEAHLFYFKGRSSASVSFGAPSFSGDEVEGLYSTKTRTGWMWRVPQEQEQLVSK